MDIIIDKIIGWTNENSGFLGLLIFIASLIIGWVAGLFKYLRKRPKLNIKVIEEPTFGSIKDLEQEYKGYAVNKTAFAIYLEIANIGNAPSSIGEIRLGYLKRDLRPKWLTSRVWLPETVSKTDFKIKFPNSEFTKVYPFLKQKNYSTNNETDTYLPVGKSITGIAYFEQPNAYGNYVPRLNKDLKTTDLLIKIKDVFGKSHKKKFTIKMVEPDYTLKFNPYFGQTQFEYKEESDNKNE